MATGEGVTRIPKGARRAQEAAGMTLRPAISSMAPRTWVIRPLLTPCPYPATAAPTLLHPLQPRRQRLFRHLLYPIRSQILG